MSPCTAGGSADAIHARRRVPENFKKEMLRHVWMSKCHGRDVVAIRRSRQKC